MRNARSRLKKAVLAIFALAFVSASNPSKAETVTLKCDAPSEMTLVYEGDDSGTLTVTDSSGAFSLPASMEKREGDVDGTPTKATGILANGPVSILMPDKAAIEACVKSKLSGDLLQDFRCCFHDGLRVQHVGAGRQGAGPGECQGRNQRGRAAERVRLHYAQLR